MTPLEDKTVNYLAGEFSKLGLQPAFGGSWFQTVKEISSDLKPKDNKVSVKAKKGRMDLLYPDDLVIWTALAKDKIEVKNAQFVFCGFGIEAPEYGWNDFEGADVKGKVVIAMVNDPGYYDDSLFRGRNMTYYGRWCYKFEKALELGAAACLVLHNESAASYGWHVCVNGHTQKNLALFDDRSGNLDQLAFRGWFNEDACRRLFEKSGLDFDSLIAAAKKPGFRAVTLDARCSATLNVRYTVEQSRNVGAILPGTDLKDECVVFSAHWDHFGTGKPDETGDAIYNGAADNGSGLAAIMMLAKKLQSMDPLRRSVLLLATTSEESGLLGSQYYCDHPVFPLDKTVTCVNFDCVVPAPLTKDIAALSSGDRVIESYLEAAAAAQGRTVDLKADNSDGWFYRSDHYNFVKKGVPCIVVRPGKELVDKTKVNKYPKPSWYHKPNDEYHEDWDLSGGLENVNLMFSVGVNAANLGR